MKDVPKFPIDFDMGDLIKHLVDKYPHDGELHEKLLGEFYVALLDTMLQLYRYNQTSVAKALGINRGTLRKKMKAYGIIGVHDAITTRHDKET